MLIPMQRGDPVSGFYRPSAVRMLEIRGGGFCPRCAPDNLSFLISKVAPAAVAVAPAAACGPGAAAPLRRPPDVPRRWDPLQPYTQKLPINRLCRPVASLGPEMGSYTSVAQGAYIGF